MRPILYKGVTYGGCNLMGCAPLNMPVEIENSGHIGVYVLQPFAEKEYIDLDRTRRILGISYWTAVRMAHSGLIYWMDHGKATHKRILYQAREERYRRS